jgi:serine protease Do
LSIVGRVLAESKVDLAPPELPDLAELKELEAHVSQAIRIAMPAIVAVDVHRPGEFANPRVAHFSPSSGSGVIIARDGLILSQWHVSHKLNTGLLRGPGDEIEIALQDGRHLKAELLGADPVRDLSLLRIIEPGDYPHLALAKPNSVIRGDRVLKLGHPFGYRASRGATARLGRVLYLGESIEIDTDCLISGGDSGGPLINLDGDVIGIIENGSSPQFVIWNLPERSGFPTCYSSVATIERMMPSMRNPTRGKKPDPGFKVQDLPEHKAMMAKRLEEIYGDTDSKVLPVDEWTQGEKTRAKWNDLTRLYSGTVIEVLSHGRRVSFGTVVGSDGWILTKASEIPDDPKCKLADGQVVPARVAGVDPAYDLALLKVDAHGLRAIEWSVEKVRPAGKFVAAPDGRGGSIGVGIVCVEQRALEGPFPTTITKTKPYIPKTTPPEVLGKMIEGKGLLVRRVKDGAAKAGIVPGDLLLSLNGQPIRDHDDVDKCVEMSSPGDILPIVLERDGQRLNVSLKLGEDPYVRCPGAISRYRNMRADDFPFVFEHDIPLTLDECGGPIIDLNGKAIGITIARVARHGCMAIPADAIAPLVLRLKNE